MTTPERETAISGKMAARSSEPREGSIAQPDFGCTLLECQPGYLATKRYRGDASAEPEEIAIGKFFRPLEIPASATFDDLADALGTLPPDVFAVRGALVQGVRDELAQGVLTYCPRRSHGQADGEATFEPRARSWVMLDVDDPRHGEEPRPWHAVPLDPADVASSVHAWHATLPDELRAARSTFFLSGSSHRKPHVRGHLLVMLAAPIDNATAESYAFALGFDGSVCRTVQPIFCAAPVFDACTDPLAGRRTPIAFDGEPARLSFDATIRSAATRPLASGGALPATLPAPSEDAIALANAIRVRWLDGGRIETHAWLHLAGWLLGARWDKGEVGALLALLDADEGDDRKRAEHVRVLVNARPLDGPGGARAWLAEDFATVDGIVNRKRNAWMATFGKHAAACDAPLILQSLTDAGTVLLWQGEHGHQPIALEVLRQRIAELKLPIETTKTNRKGDAMPLSPRAIVERNSATYRETIHDFAASVSRYEPEHERVIIGYPATKLAPKRDADVDAWLRAMGGAEHDRLEAWIASCAQANIDRLAASLILLGPADVGKTMFACAVAGLWGCAVPPSADLLVARFNGDLSRCPIVFDDEAVLFGSEDLSTKRFRKLVQSTERTIERKGRERTILRGGMRLIVAANEVSDLRFSDVTGPEVVRAVADRMLVLATQPRADACKEALARLRPPGQYRVNLDRVVAHMAWLCGRVPMPAERFIGAGGMAEAATLAGHVERFAEVFDLVREVLDKPADEGHPMAPVFLSGGAVWVRLQAVAQLLGRPWDACRVATAIGPFRDRSRSKIRFQGNVVRAACLNLDRLASILA